MKKEIKKSILKLYFKKLSKKSVKKIMYTSNKA